MRNRMNNLSQPAFPKATKKDGIMPEEKHTPTPYLAKYIGKTTWAVTNRTGTITLAKFSTKDVDWNESQAEFIVKACNSHAKWEAVIAGLVGALEKAVGLLEAIEHQPLIGEAKELAQMQDALADAREKPCQTE